VRRRFARRSLRGRSVVDPRGKTLDPPRELRSLQKLARV
jgi:hypothetical protein